MSNASLINNPDSIGAAAKMIIQTFEVAVLDLEGCNET